MRNAARWDEEIDTPWLHGVIDGFGGKPEAVVAIFSAVEERYASWQTQMLLRGADDQVEFRTYDPEEPASFAVARSGASGARSSLATKTRRSLPACAGPISGASGRKARSTRPSARSGRAAMGLRYGT